MQETVDVLNREQFIDIIEYLKEKKNIAMTHTRIIGMNSEEIMVSNDFNGEAWHILDQLLAHKKTLYMNPVNQTVDIDECKKFIEFAKILWQSKIQYLHISE